MEDLYFKMKGSAFDEGLQLDKSVAGLTGLQQFFDGIYKGATGKGRISKTDRERYKVLAQEIKQGCLLVEFGAFYSGIQNVLPLYSNLTTGDFWTDAKSTAQFLYDIYKNAHAGNTLQVSQGDDGVSVVVNGDDNQTTVYTGPVYQFATPILQGLRTLDDALDEDAVHAIELGSKHENHPILNMSSSEKGLYYAPITVDQTPKVLMCDIFDFNKYDKVGKMLVQEGQAIPEGKYRFKVVGSQTVEDFILSMTHKLVTVNCLTEIENDPLKGEKIGQILITDISGH